MHAGRWRYYPSLSSLFSVSSQCRLHHLSGSTSTSSSPCSLSVGRYDADQEEVTGGALSTMALEQRGPPQEGLSLSAPHLRGSWGDGLHPRPLAMPKATHIARPQNMPLAPPLTIPLATPLTTPCQTEAGSDSEGEYVELEEMSSLSPQHSLTQCISLGYHHTPGNTPGLATHTPVPATHTPGLTPGSATHTRGLTPVSATHTPGHTPVSATHTLGLTPASATHSAGQTSGLATHTTGFTPVSARQSGRGTPLRAPRGQPVRGSEETQRHSLTTSSSQHPPTGLSQQPAEETELTESLKDLSTDSLTGPLTGSITERLILDARRRNLPVRSHVMSRGVLCLPGESSGNCVCVRVCVRACACVRVQVRVQVQVQVRVQVCAGSRDHRGGANRNCVCVCRQQRPVWGGSSYCVCVCVCVQAAETTAGGQ